MKEARSALRSATSLKSSSVMAVEGVVWAAESIRNEQRRQRRFFISVSVILELRDGRPILVVSGGEISRRNAVDAEKSGCCKPLRASRLCGVICGLNSPFMLGGEELPARD
ncbi:MAG: hypothetical protein DME25_12385 [Verrucomicrobia bacterium]|nr:MAG: hypothetical protein DME25_12385 [Verrucomicrobiota bacterium]